MTFGKLIKGYLENAGSNASRLCNVTGLTPSQMSRYINDKRKPATNSKVVKTIAAGLCALDATLDYDEVFRNLNSMLMADKGDVIFFTENLNLLIDELRINTSDLAYSMNYDASFISRIKKGERRPSNFAEFCEGVGKYIASHCTGEAARSSLAVILNCSPEEIRTKAGYTKKIAQFLGSDEWGASATIEKFLVKLDNTMISDPLDIQKSKLPSSPLLPMKDKYYFGIEGMQRAEKEFFRYTLLSNSKRNVFIHSEMGMKEVDSEQQKQLVNAVTLLLGKNIGIDIIHNIDRSLDEMLLGIEVWIPFYMTGRINSYYIPAPAANLFPQILCTSGAIAMHGECIGSNQNKMVCYTSTNRKLLDFFHAKQNHLIRNAKPLIKTYSEIEEKKFRQFVQEYEDEITEYETGIFRNINFTVCEGKWVSVNKAEAPEMHFVIFNEKLNHAIIRFLETESMDSE